MQISLFEKQKSTDWKWSMKDDYPKELKRNLEKGKKTNT